MDRARVKLGETVVVIGIGGGLVGRLWDGKELRHENVKESKEAANMDMDKLVITVAVDGAIN